MNANEQNLIQYVIDGDIRKAQEQVKIILDNTNTAKDSVFKETMLRKMSVRQIGQIELPYNMKEIAIAEDVRNFPENRFVLRESEKQVIDKLFAVRKAALQLQNEGRESPRFQPWDDRPTIMVFFVFANIIVM